MAFHVIDTIEHRAEWTHRYPDIAAKGDGLLVILAPSEPLPDASLTGQSVLIHRPDGGVSEHVVATVEKGANDVPGLFFRGLRAEDVPRGSIISRSQERCDDSSSQLFGSILSRDPLARPPSPGRKHWPRIVGRTRTRRLHFDDLDACTYHPGPLDAAEWGVPLRAVGWLEHPHPFEAGSVSPGLASRIGQLVEQTGQAFPHYRFRGVHDCSVCQAAGRVSGMAWSKSQDNLIVPGRDEVYAAPGGIVHYISDHSYLPPAIFLEAVAACPDCGSEEYFEALRRANGGRPPPVQSSEQFSREVRSSAEKVLAFRRALGVPVMQATRAQVLTVARTIWPEASLSDDTESIYLGDVRVLFDKGGRVVDVS